MRGLEASAGFSYTLYIVHYPLFLLGFSLLHPTLHGYDWPLSLGAAAVMVGLGVVVARALARIVEDRAMINSLARTFRQPRVTIDA